MYRVVKGKMHYNYFSILNVSQPALQFIIQIMSNINVGMIVQI